VEEIRRHFAKLDGSSGTHERLSAETLHFLIANDDANITRPSKTQTKIAPRASKSPRFKIVAKRRKGVPKILPTAAAGKRKSNKGPGPVKETQLETRKRGGNPTSPWQSLVEAR
jgi:hypothetical protein